MEDFSQRVQLKAERHLTACFEAMDGAEETSPAAAPFDGCPTCIVREVLEVTWDELMAEARREVAGADRAD